jgi:hypothetical protein
VLCYRLYAVLLLLCCTVIVLLLLLFVLSLLLFVLSYVLIVCTVSLPPGVNSIAVDKYIISCGRSGGVAPLINILVMRWSKWPVSASDSFTHGKSPSYSQDKMPGPRAGFNFLELKQVSCLCTKSNQGS